MSSKSYLNFFDILSEKPQIKVKGNTRYHTNFSILVCFISYLFIFILSIIFISDVFSKKKINLVYNLDNRKYSNISLAGKHVGLLISDPFGKEIENFSRIYNIRAKYWQVTLPSFNYLNNTINNSTSTNTNNNNEAIDNQPKAVITEVLLNDCKTLERINSAFASTNKFYKSSVCVDLGKNNISLAGKYGAIQGFSMLNIYLIKCVNSTENGNKCLPEEQIDKVLALAILSIFTTEYDVNPDDIESPLQEYNNLDQVRISSSIFKRFDKKYNRIVFNNDKGLINSDIEVLEAYRGENILESVDLRGSNTIIPGTFNQLTLQGSGKNEVFTRRLMGFPTALANIVGILQVTLVIGKLLIYFWSKNSMLDFVISHVFNEDEKDDLLKYFTEKKNTRVLNLIREINFKNGKKMFISIDNYKNQNNINSFLENKASNNTIKNKNISNMNNKLNEIKEQSKIEDSNNDLINYEVKRNIINFNSQKIKNYGTVENKDLVTSGDLHKKLKKLNEKNSKQIDLKFNNDSEKAYDNNKSYKDFIICCRKINKDFVWNKQASRLILNDNLEAMRKNEDVDSSLNNMVNQNKNNEMQFNYVFKEGRNTKILTNKKAEIISSNDVSKINKSKKLFGVWEKICISNLIPDKGKRKFIDYSNTLFDRMFSIEHILSSLLYLDETKSILPN